VALHALGGQDTGGLFTYSAVVVDNDPAESARTVAGSAEGIDVEYRVQPRQGIAVARNTAIANARGEYVAFLDDDEYPIREWLRALFETLGRHDADGALGPVKPYYDESAPRWVMKGGFYVRPSYPTGFVIDWKKGRTGNVLLKSELFTGEAEIFRERADLRCGIVIVACQEHDSPATMYGRILVQDGSDQMVEALDQLCTRECLCNELGRRLSPQFFRRHAVGVGHIDDGLPLPGGQRLRHIRVRFKTHR